MRYLLVSMDFIKGIFNTSLGRKYIMAVTGAGLFGFIIAHLLGNLLVFAGPEAINTYAKKLHDLGPLLWVARLGLLGMVGLHIWSAIKLTAENRKARVVPYAGEVAPVDNHRRDEIISKFAARTMIYSGLIIAAFALYHLAHYTWKVPQINGVAGEVGGNFENYYVADDLVTRKEGKEGKDPVDVYRMVVTGFQVPWVSAFYLVAVGLLCVHLSHGMNAMFQSLGLKTKKTTKLLSLVAPGVSWLLFLGYSSVPLSILLKIVKIQQ